MLERIRFERFTAFEKLTIEFSSGINIFIGENGTGKTHIMKAAYSACEVSKGREEFATKLNRVFLPKHMANLVKNSETSNGGLVEVARKIEKKATSLQAKLIPNKGSLSSSSYGYELWTEDVIEAVYIPVKDMMANAPGFQALYENRNIHFEEVYVDIIRKAFLPSLRKLNQNQENLLALLEEKMGGKVVSKNEEFYLENEYGELEFTLLAEGFRKLGLLWLLIRNGSLQKGSVLFWDEPETNLNPKLMETVVGILVELQRMGVQVFISTHDYVILKEFDLQTGEQDQIKYHSLYRDKDTREITVDSVSAYSNIAENAIDDTFGSLVDREIRREWSQ